MSGPDQMLQTCYCVSFIRLEAVRLICLLQSRCTILITKLSMFRA